MKEERRAGRPEQGTPQFRQFGRRRKLRVARRELISFSHFSRNSKLETRAYQITLPELRNTSFRPTTYDQQLLTNHQPLATRHCHSHSQREQLRSHVLRDHRAEQRVGVGIVNRNRQCLTNLATVAVEDDNSVTHRTTGELELV